MAFEIKANRQTLLSIIATLLMVAAGYSKIWILSIVVIACFVPLIIKYEYLICPLFVSSVFDDNLVAFEGQSFGRFITIFVLIGLIYRTILMNGGKVKLLNKVARRTLVTLIILAVILSFRTVYGFSSFPVTFVLNTVLCYMMIISYDGDSDIIYRQLVIACYIAVVYVICSYFIGGASQIDINQQFHVGVNQVNSNQTGMGLAMISAIASYKVFCSKYKKNKIASSIIFFLLILAVLLTGSRSAFLATIAAIFTVVLLGNDNHALFIKIIGSIIVVILIVVLLMAVLAQYYPLLVERFSIDNVLSNGGTHRIDIWQAYFDNCFYENLFLGIGFDPRNFSYLIYNTLGYTRGAHNIIIEILSSTGIVGLILFVIFISFTLFTFIKEKKKCRTIIIPIGIVIGSLVDGIGENVFTVRLLWISIGIGYLLINKSKEVELYE